MDEFIKYITFASALMAIVGMFVLTVIVLMTLTGVIPTVDKSTQTEAKKNCSGSWPDPTWTKEDYEKKDKILKQCRIDFGIKNEGKTWE